MVQKQQHHFLSMQKPTLMGLATWPVLKCSLHSRTDLTKTNNTFVTISDGQMEIINFGLGLSRLPIIYTGSEYQPSMVKQPLINTFVISLIPGQAQFLF